MIPRTDPAGLLPSIVTPTIEITPTIASTTSTSMSEYPDWPGLVDLVRAMTASCGKESIEGKNRLGEKNLSLLLTFIYNMKIVCRRFS
jgi:hypothetical protein